MELAISFNPLTPSAFPTASSIAHSPHDQREDEVLRFHFVYGKQECEWFGFHSVIIPQLV
jgi:hypothetical protein